MTVYFCVVTYESPCSNQTVVGFIGITLQSRGSQNRTKSLRNLEDSNRKKKRKTQMDSKGNPTDVLGREGWS